MLTASTATALRVGLETLRSNPLRTILSTVGVMIGVASLVAVLSLGDGMERYGLERIRDEGMQVVEVAPVEADTVDGVRVARDSAVTLTAADAADLARVLPVGTQVTMRVSGTGLVQADGRGRARGTYVVGLLPARDHPAVPVAHGRMFTPQEAAAGAPVAVLSAALADTLAGAGRAASLVGRTVRFSTGAERTVVGVLAAHDAAAGSQVLVPVSGVAALLGAAGTARRPPLPTVQAHAASIDSVAAVRAAAERWAAGRWPEWRRQVRVLSQGRARLEQLQQGVLLFKLFMGAIVSISLVVGGIGIMNVLLASVTERTREIGIRKTTGARDRDILRQFLAEAVVVSGAGSAVGVVLGTAVAYAGSAVMRGVTDTPLQAAVTPRTLLLAITASVLVGLVFGTYPARRAARLSPIDAIRHE